MLGLLLTPALLGMPTNHSLRQLAPTHTTYEVHVDNLFMDQDRLPLTAVSCPDCTDDYISLYSELELEDAMAEAVKQHGIRGDVYADYSDWTGEIKLYVVSTTQSEAEENKRKLDELFATKESASDSGWIVMSSLAEESWEGELTVGEVEVHEAGTCDTTKDSKLGDLKTACGVCNSANTYGLLIASNPNPNCFLSDADLACYNARNPVFTHDRVCCSNNPEDCEYNVEKEVDAEQRRRLIMLAVALGVGILLLVISIVACCWCAKCCCFQQRPAPREPSPQSHQAAVANMTKATTGGAVEMPTATGIPVAMARA